MVNEKGEFRNGFFKDMDSIAVWTHEPNAYAMHSSIYIMLVLSLLFMKNYLIVLYYPTFYCMIVLLNAEERTVMSSIILTFDLKIPWPPSVSLFLIFG